jgi:hypothetical protein
VHVPAATTDTVEPLVVQTDVVREEKVTTRFEEAVALTVNGAAP